MQKDSLKLLKNGGREADLSPDIEWPRRGKELRGGLPAGIDHLPVLHRNHVPVNIREYWLAGVKSEKEPFMSLSVVCPH